MSENKDLAIKLFGKTITLPLHEEASTRECSTEKPDDGHYSQQKVRPLGPSTPEMTSATEQEGQKEEHEELLYKEISSHTREDVAAHQAMKARKTPVTTASDTSKNPKTDLIDSKSVEQSETGTSQEKTLKKPEKIHPCPRCQSMDTKFCYYNNYNVNQPRHFCKNCQRYWTAGGAIRNVPVGSGRRKNKNASASHYRHFMVPQISPTAELEVAHGVHHDLLGNTATTLTFGPNTPICDSFASALNLADKTSSLIQNGFQQPEQIPFVSCREDNEGDHLRGPSVVASDLTERRGDCGFQESVGSNYRAFPAQVPCIPGSPWPYALNSTQWNPAVPPASFPPAFPVSFYPAGSYWGCTLPSSWNVQCISPSSSSVNQRASGTGPDSATLGKHSRDGNLLSTSNLKKEEPKTLGDNAETPLLVPRTLRIDDPTEAAKSSIWEALGINEKINSTHVRSLFKGLQTEGKGKNHVVEPSVLLQANPAAFSRSLGFHEST